MSSTDRRESTPAEVVQEFHQRVLTEKNLDAAEELLSADYVEHNPAFPEGMLHGRDNLIKFWEELFEAFPDLWIDEEDVLVEGETVVTRHVGRGTHEGTFMELEATGNEFAIEGIDIFRIDDGKIAEGWISLDMMGMMQQLGAMPEPGDGSA